MHLICLGIVKKTVKVGLLWLGSGPLHVRLSSTTVQQISQALVELKETVPHEFVRKPRPLKYWKFWKGTELRQFLLFTWPIILDKFLPKDVMLIFLALHIAIKILTSVCYVNDPAYLSFAAGLLDYFVETFELIYGKNHVSHNVHNLLHLTNDVKNYGILDNFSTFRFEIFMFQLKNKIR